MRDRDEVDLSDDIIETTIAFWSPRYGRELSEEEVRQIIENLVGFFGTLLRWSATDAAAFDDEPEAA